MRSPPGPDRRDGCWKVIQEGSGVGSFGLSLRGDPNWYRSSSWYEEGGEGEACRSGLDCSELACRLGSNW